MEQNAWNARMPWPSPLLYQQSAVAPTHYHLHNFQHFEGTNICPRFPPAQRTISTEGGNIQTQRASLYECEIESDSDEDSGSYTYLVKIINPKKKSNYIVRMWHGVSEAFKTPTVLREKLRKAFPDDISTDFQIGYLEGNTKRWIVQERDLSTMYNSFDDGSKITVV